jgi:asparagine synthase (glutamine-hydrolysing)
MFALAIYDNTTKELYLARDFAGIKPLFFGIKDGGIVFGSQYDQILEHPKFNSPEINLSVLKLYLKQHFMPAPFGLHKGMHQLHPGEIIKFNSSGDLSKQRYWELPDVLPEDLIKEPKKATQLLEDSFNKSVSSQLVADVPLGAFLSGGVDSSLVCAFAKKSKPDLEVFTIGSDSKKHDESDRASQFASALEVKHKLWNLNASEVLEYWDEAMNALHEPLADFSILPTYLVSKLAKKNVTVALSGDGGDELFFGYERFWSLGKNIKYHGLPSIIRKGIYGFDKIVSSNKNVNGLLTIGSQAKAHESLHSRFMDDRLNTIAPDLQSINLPEEWDVYSYSNCQDERELMAKMRKSEFYGMMQKTLRKVDLASMQNSLEVRVPFLQKSFIETALTIDPMLSYGPNKKKEILKSSQNEYFPSMPDDNIKRGFTIPLGNWIRTGLKEKFEEAIEKLESQSSLFKRD